MINHENLASNSILWTDGRILSVVQSDNPTEHDIGWNRLVEKYQPVLDKRALALMKGNDFWAGDLAQETWIKANKSITQCRTNLKGWLLAIMLNQYRDDQRKNRLESTNVMVNLGLVNKEDKQTDLTESAAGFIKERKAFEADARHLAGIDSSAEDIFMDHLVIETFQASVRKLLSPSEADFFLKYQDDTNLKSGQAKVKFHRLKKRVKEACWD